jgi:hypothetical protein
LVGFNSPLTRVLGDRGLCTIFRGYAAEFGVTAASGLCRIEPLLATIAADETIPVLARELFLLHGQEFGELQYEIERVDEKLMTWHRSDECSQRLARIPGVGPIGASLLMMKTPDPCGLDPVRRQVHLASVNTAWMTGMPGCPVTRLLFAIIAKYGRNVVAICRQPDRSPPRRAAAGEFTAKACLIGRLPVATLFMVDSDGCFT